MNEFFILLGIFTAAILIFLCGYFGLWLLLMILPKGRKRLNYACVTHSNAEQLLKVGWTIAHEEDNNHVRGFVCLGYLDPLQRKLK